MRKLRTVVALFAAIVSAPIHAACAQHPEPGVGFQWAAAQDGDDRPIRLAIWYPSEAPARATQIGPYQLNVAMDGAPRAGAAPLIVISHGTGGSLFNSANLAVSLAEAGFVVAALMHTGDNYEDQSHAFSRRNFVDRPRHITRVIDFMLGAWPGRGVIDPERIGIFGHSAGGAASLIAIGGWFDWNEVAAYCQIHPDEWGCRHARERRAGPSNAEGHAPPIIAGDARIGAAVLAAPALSVAFEPDGLAQVSIPVQVWAGEHDAIAPDAVRIQSLLPRPAAFNRVADAGHFSFLAPCNAILRANAPQICADPPGFDRADFQREFTREVVRFFTANLEAKS